MGHLPGETAAAGAALAGVGGAGAPGTGGLSAAAVPLGSGLAVVGATGVAGSLSNLLNLWATANASMQKSDQTPAGESKSTTPTGQTSSGQKTNAYGEKLGGSGRPVRNNPRLSTTKGAKDAARQAGKSGPVRDKGHFHATDRNGNRLPNAGHYQFPE